MKGSDFVSCDLSWRPSLRSPASLTGVLSLSIIFLSTCTVALLDSVSEHLHVYAQV